MPPRAILTDIEGTTSSITFVKDTLFPYAARALPDFLHTHHDRPDIAAEIAATRILMGQPDASLNQVIDQLQIWIQTDQKVTPLKTLQGFIWEQGYQDGAYTAHLYPDAHQQLQHWHQQGLKLYIYSSGSIWAQKLFFRYSDFGDLLPLFSGHFDTTTGPKRDPDSYRNIATAIVLPPTDILFLSDILAELDAAQSAGFQTTWLVRPEDTTATDIDLAETSHPWVRSFLEV